MKSSESEETITFFLMYQRTTSVCFTVLQAFSNRCTQCLALTCSQFSTWFLYHLSCHLYSHLKYDPCYPMKRITRAHMLTVLSFFLSSRYSISKRIAILINVFDTAGNVFYHFTIMSISTIPLCTTQHHYCCPLVLSMRGVPYSLVHILVPS